MPPSVCRPRSMSPGFMRKRGRVGWIAAGATHRAHAHIFYQTDGAKNGECIAGSVLL